MIQYSVLHDKVVHLDDNTVKHYGQQLYTWIEQKVELRTVPSSDNDYFLQFNWRYKMRLDAGVEPIFTMVTETVYHVVFSKGYTIKSDIEEIFEHALSTLTETIKKNTEHLIEIRIPLIDYSERVKELVEYDLPKNNLW